MSEEQIINTIALLIVIAAILGVITLIKWIFHFIKTIVLGAGRVSHKAITKIYQNGYDPIRSKNKRQDLDRIFLRAKIHVRIPKTEYFIGNPVYQQFIESPYKIDNLNMFTQHILKRIDYRGNEPQISYAPLLNDMSTHSFNRQKVSITINTRIEDPYILAALVIRECIRLYMFDNHIDYAPEYLPEQNVDVYAVYMGFYNALVQGYEKIGALNASDLKYVRKQVQKYQREQK